MKVTRKDLPKGTLMGSTCWCGLRPGKVCCGSVRCHAIARRRAEAYDRRIANPCLFCRRPL